MVKLVSTPPPLISSPLFSAVAQLLEMCDDVRDNVMVDLGVRVEDRADLPSLWKLDDAATLRREVRP